jgi:hypothetical protein
VVSGEYLRRQADVCLQLAQVSEEHVASRLIAMAEQFHHKATEIDRSHYRGGSRTSFSSGAEALSSGQVLGICFCYHEFSLPPVTGLTPEILRTSLNGND